MYVQIGAKCRVIFIGKGNKNYTIIYILKNFWYASEQDNRCVSVLNNHYTKKKETGNSETENRKTTYKTWLLNE